MEERLTMTTRELDRLKVIHQVLQRKLTWPQAAAQLTRSIRQIGRLCARVRTEGHRGILHRLRGQPSNHRLPAERLAKALELVKTRYPDFGPTFATEKLRERHRLRLSTATVRRGMMAAGLWRPHHRQERHRAWRPRRACVGELVQLDGSDHAWFEARAPRCVLLLYIDDATSRLLEGAFVAVEDTLTLLRTTKTYLQRAGRPVAFYVDKDSIYRVNRQATIEEQLQETAPLTQFTRAMTELGIAVIPAHSPQAKGRVERSFDTHQDRLVKELRLADISERPAANRFLRERYFPAHNRRYAVEPANPTDAHRPLLPLHDLDAILSVQTTRTVERDFTVRLQNRFFQLLPTQPVWVRPTDTVLIEQRLDGSMHLRGKGRYLAFQPIAKRPPQRVVVLATPPGPRRPRRVWRPPMTHPYKTASYQAMRRQHAVRAQAPSPSHNGHSRVAGSQTIASGCVVEPDHRAPRGKTWQRLACLTPVSTRASGSPHMHKLSTLPPDPHPSTTTTRP